MKKIFISALMFIAVLFFSYCSSSKKAAGAAPLTYDTNLMAVISEKCSPCHIPDKGGRVKPLNTYDAVKTNIDNIISRIQLNPTDKGFMPFKHDKLSDSTIALFVQWRTDGLREK